MEPDGYQFPQMGKTRVSFLHRPTRRRRVSEAYLLFGKRNTRLFFHPHQCRRHILAIIEAMLQVRLQQDVVELLRQVYVAYGNCFSEKRGNLLVLETCDTASDTCDEKLHV